MGDRYRIGFNDGEEGWIQQAGDPEYLAGWEAGSAPRRAEDKKRWSSTNCPIPPQPRTPGEPGGGE